MAHHSTSDNFEIESDDDSFESLMNLDELTIEKRPTTNAPISTAAALHVAPVAVEPSDDSAELSFDEEEDAEEDDEDSEFLLAEDTLDRLTLSESQTPSAAAGAVSGRRRSSRRRTLHLNKAAEEAKDEDNEVEHVEFAASDSSMMVKLIESMSASHQEHRRPAMTVVPEAGGNPRFQLAALQVHTMLRVLQAWQFARVLSSRQPNNNSPSADSLRVLRHIQRLLTVKTDDEIGAPPSHALNRIGVVPAVRWLKEFCTSSRDNAAAMGSPEHMHLMFDIIEHTSALVRSNIIAARRASNHTDDDVLKHVSHRYCPSRDCTAMVTLGLMWELVGCVLSPNGDDASTSSKAMAQWVQKGLHVDGGHCDPMMQAVELSVAAGGTWTGSVASVLLSMGSSFEPHYALVSPQAAPRLSAAVGVVCQCIRDTQGTAFLARWLQTLFALASTVDTFCADIVQGSTSFNARESAAVVALYDTALHIAKLVADVQVRGASAFALVECSLSIALACVEHASLAPATSSVGSASATSALVTETALCRWYMLYDFIGTATDSNGTLDAASDGELSDANSKVDSMLFEKPFSSFYAQTGARWSRYQHAKDGDDDRLPSKEVINDVVAQYAKLLSELVPCIKHGDTSVRSFCNAATQCRVQLGCALTTSSSMDIRQAILSSLIHYVSLAQASSTDAQVADLLGVRSVLRSSAMNAAEGDEVPLPIFGACAKLLLKLLPMTGCGTAEFFGITNQIKRVAALLGAGATTTSNTSRVTTPSSKSRGEIKAVLATQMAVLAKAARINATTADWGSVMTAVDTYGGALLHTLVLACAAPEACDTVLPTLVEVDAATAGNLDDHQSVPGVDQLVLAAPAPDVKYRQLTANVVSKIALQTSSVAGRIGLVGLLARWINVDGTICDSEAVQSDLLAMLFTGSPDASMVSENPITPHVILLLHLAVTRRTLSTPNIVRLMRSSIGLLTTLGGDARAHLAAAKFINSLVITKQFSKCAMDAKSLVSQLLLLPMVNQNIETHTLSSIVHTIASIAVSERDVFDLVTHDRLNAERMFLAVIGVCDGCHAVEEHEVLAAAGLTVRDAQVVKEFWAHVMDARQALTDSKNHDDESKILKDAVVSIETLKQKYKAEVEHHELTKQHLERSMISRGGSSHVEASDTFTAGIVNADSHETGWQSKLATAEADSRVQILLLATDEAARLAVAHALSLVQHQSRGYFDPPTIGLEFNLLYTRECSGRYKLQSDASDAFAATAQQWSETRNADARVASLAHALTVDVIDRAVSPPRWRSTSPDNTHRLCPTDPSPSSSWLALELCEGNERRMILENQHTAYLDAVMHCATARQRLASVARVAAVSPPRTVDAQEVRRFAEEAYGVHQGMREIALDGHLAVHVQAQHDLHTIKKVLQVSQRAAAEHAADASNLHLELLRKRLEIEDESTLSWQRIRAFADERAADIKSDMTRKDYSNDTATASLRAFEDAAIASKQTVGDALLVANSSGAAPGAALLSQFSVQLAGMEKHHKGVLSRSLKDHQDSLHQRERELQNELDAKFLAAASEAESLRAKVGILESSLRTLEEESAESVKRALEGSGLNEMYKKSMDLLKSMQKAKLQDMQRDAELAQQQLAAQNEKHHRTEQQHLKTIAGLKSEVEDLEKQLKYKESNSILSSHVQGTAVTTLRQHGEKLKEQLAAEEATRKSLEARLSAQAQLHQSETEALIHRHNKSTEAAKKQFEEHLARQQVESRKEAAEREGQERVILEQRAKESMAKVAVMESRVSELEGALGSLKQSTSHEMETLRTTIQSLQASVKSVKARADELEALNDTLQQKYSDERKGASMARELVESERIEHHLERQRNAKEMANLQESLRESEQVSDRQAQKIVQEEQKNNILIKKLAMLELEDRVMHKTRGLEAFQHTTTPTTAGSAASSRGRQRLAPSVSPHKKDPSFFTSHNNASAHDDSVGSAERFRRQRMEAADLMAQYVESQRRYYEVEGGQQRVSKVDQLKKLAARPSSLAGVKALSRSKGNSSGSDRRVAWELSGSAADDSGAVPSASEQQGASTSEILKDPFDVPAAANQRGGYFEYRAEDDPHLHEFFRKGKR